MTKVIVTETPACGGAETERDPKRYARPGTIWVCAACGKTADLDCYGIEGAHSRGWDESCMLNAILCDAASIRRDEHGRVTEAKGAA